MTNVKTKLREQAFDTMAQLIYHYKEIRKLESKLEDLNSEFNPVGIGVLK